MPVFKNEDNGTWYVMARYVNWKGERKQKCKRGFATKREAQEWERMFKLQTSSDLDMSFEAFTELYINDVKNRLKENTWLTKEHIIRTKILPYFGKLKISEISTKEIITWQNEMLAAFSVLKFQQALLLVGRRCAVPMYRSTSSARLRSGKVLSVWLFGRSFSCCIKHICLMCNSFY